MVLPPEAQLEITERVVEPYKYRWGAVDRPKRRLELTGGEATAS